MRPQVYNSLNSKYPWFVSLQGVSRDAGTDVTSQPGPVNDDSLAKATDEVQNNDPNKGCVPLSQIQ